MKIDNITCKCGSKDCHINKKGNNVGAYCNCCGKWIKWLNKNENRVAEYQAITSPNDYIIEK